MADEATTTVSVDAPAPAAAVEPIDPPQTNGDAKDVPKEDEETAGPQATTEVNPPDGDGTTEVAEPPSAPAADGDVDNTPTSAGKKDKRKSVGGVPEHKSKKLNKKKSMPTLHLDCKPGEHYWARLKGYPPWPAVICDEQMLPESLLASRPVSTTRPDGSLRDDFKEGGKNAKERTFPIMFLSTNEFTWMVNTSLTPLDPAECTVLPNSKMTNALKKAWQIASEQHDLDYFKGILKTWQEEQAQIEKELAEQEEKEAAERERKAAEDAERAANAAEEDAKPKKKAKSRKSKSGDDDVEMEDADAPKSSKKRKNEGDADGAKPKKTPKVTKLNAPKTPNGEGASAKKSSTKSKKKIVQAPKEDEEDEKPQMTEAEKLAQREKAVLYLRHRLQKGFLSRDQAPQESEMPGMAEFFGQLEAYENLEPSIIRTTKVHKVLKAIVKLASIPKDDLYNFKKRSAAMLETWNKRMEAETSESAPASAVEAPKVDALAAVEEKKETPETNGDKASATEVAGERVVPVAADAEPATVEEETMEGAKEVDEIVTEAKADVAAEQLDEKVETAEVPDDKMEVVEEPKAAVADKIEPGNDAKDEATDGEILSRQPTVEEVTDAAT